MAAHGHCGAGEAPLDPGPASTPAAADAEGEEGPLVDGCGGVGGVEGPLADGYTGVGVSGAIALAPRTQALLIPRAGETSLCSPLSSCLASQARGAPLQVRGPGRT